MKIGKKKIKEKGKIYYTTTTKKSPENKENKYLKKKN